MVDNVNLNEKETKKLLKEWSESVDWLVDWDGSETAGHIINQVIDHAKQSGLQLQAGISTPYFNTLSNKEDHFLSDKDVMLMTKLTNCMRWNAMCMVIKAGKKNSALGGHLATYGSSAWLFEVALHKYIGGSDCVFFQGHASPGIYARAFLEGRLDESMLDHFRQEINQPGLSSYPHPWLMPDFWQFPTVSMGLGPYNAIYQAHFLQYLQNRGLADTSKQRVWAFLGDGEMGEPESVGALAFAAQEKLNHLTFVISCNLQRLDGPVMPNHQVVQTLEGVFSGAGWRVIKVVWSSGWDRLFAKDTSGILPRRISELIDGEEQNYYAHGGAYMRQHFFGKSEQLLALVSDMSDEDIQQQLLPGGHDPRKLFSAYREALKPGDQPVVILARTIKGFGLGEDGEAQYIAHNKKKMTVESLLAFRDRFDLPLTDKQVESLEFYKPEKDSEGIQYLLENRKALGGFIPKRIVKDVSLQAPELAAFETQLKGSADREISTTMVFGRIFATMLKDKQIGKHVVPIFVDETRTFGMEGFFRQVGIYSSCGQNYDPVDKGTLMYYKESKTGQILQEGLSEASGIASWTAAATSYATTGVPMIPVFIYYSMFGYQRVGDFMWAAGDAMARGFIVGGTAGRTTLAGEGLQHQDGHNLIAFGFIPNCVSYDPTFSYEIAVIMQNGMKRMFQDQENIFYYITAMNENYVHPEMPEGIEEDLLKGLYLFKKSEVDSAYQVQLLGSGTILREVIAAAEILEKEFAVSCDIWSATSFNELRKDAEDVRHYNYLHPEEKNRLSHVQHKLGDCTGPVIAATDYMKVYADQIRAEIAVPYYVLGTDGYGRSAGREALRQHFEVDASHIAYQALYALHCHNDLVVDWQEVRKRLHIDMDKPNPVTQ